MNRKQRHGQAMKLLRKWRGKPREYRLWVRQMRRRRSKVRYAWFRENVLMAKGSRYTPIEVHNFAWIPPSPKEI